MAAPKAHSEVLGLDSMLGVLRELPEALQKNALSSIARAGIREVQKEAYVQLGIVMGRSVKSDDVIIKKRRGNRGQVKAEWVCGPPTRKPQLRWLHNGTRPHPIRATHADALVSVDGEIFGELITHPGQEPQPWLERAYFLSRDPQIRACAKATAKALVRQTKILASRKYRSRNLRSIRRAAGGILFG